MDTDEKQYEGHLLQCSCGETAMGHKCSHCDTPCWNKRCKKCGTVIEDKEIRNMGKSPEAYKAWLGGNK